MGKYELIRPIEIDGKEVKTLEYDFESLTGNDIQEMNKELARLGFQVGIAELDMNYHAAFFAKASGIAFEDLGRLNAKDYNKVVTMVRDFFLSDATE